jgi:hypothetical protein
MVVTGPAGEAVVIGPALQSLAEWAENKLEIAERDNARVMEDIVGRILAGTTVDDVLGAGRGNTVSGENFVDKPFLAHGFTITRSGYEDQPWYANIDAETLFGDRRRVIVNTGAPKILAALKALEAVGTWPIAVQIDAAKTSAGYEVLALVKADVPTAAPF